MSLIPQSSTTRPEDKADTRYRGLPSPLEKSPRGYLQTAYTRRLIKSSIYNILSTAKGERVFLPEFGTSLHSLLFEPMDNITRKIAQNIVTEDIQRWEPRVTLLSSEVTSDTDQGILYIKVRYLINVTGDSDEASLTLSA
jgi:phage baseplate assembly protein W